MKLLLLFILIIITIILIITICVKNEPFAAGIKTSRNLREKFFKKAIEIFNKHDIQYYVGYGTLLGIIRENRLLKSDDDIDIMVHSNDYDKAYKLLKSYGIPMIYGKNFSHGLVIHGRVEIYKYIIKDNMVIDLWAPNAKYEHSQHFNDIYPLSKKEVLGIQVNIPRSPEKVLERIYSDWKTPTYEKGHKSK